MEEKEEKSRAQSALDIIFIIEEKLNFLEKKIDVIDSNLKLLNNKVAKLQKFSASPTPIKEVEKKEVFSKSGKAKEDLIIGKIKVYGRLANKNKQPISGASVKIYDNSGDIIKTRQTDSEGYWEARLPEGKYGIEYIYKGFKPINIVINIDETMSSYEVR